METKWRRSFCLVRLQEEKTKEDSDVDVLIITSYDSFKMQKLVSEVAVNVLLRTGIYVSAKVMTADEFDFLREVNSPFYRSVMEEGITAG